jgi:hypothetical protein
MNREQMARYILEHRDEIDTGGLRTTIAATPATSTVVVPRESAPSTRAAAPPRTTLTAAEAMAVDVAFGQVTQRITAFARQQEQRARQLADISRRIEEVKRLQAQWTPSQPGSEEGGPTDPLTAWEQRAIRERERR